MRKLGVFLMLVALSAVFYACHKEELGVYQPKMKISKIFSESDGHYLQEEWTWDGDLLSKIDFYRKSGNLNYSYQYVYEDNRLAKIEMGDKYAEFLYDGKMLRTIKVYSGDHLAETYELSYEKQKLSNIVIEKTAKHAGTPMFLHAFLPDGGQELDFCFASQEKAESYNFSSADVDFLWNGDNIQFVKMKIARPDSTQRLTFSYVYDEMNNPLNGFLGLYLDHQLLNDAPQYCFCSRNNTLSVLVTDEYDVFSNTESYTYSYDYYKKFPTKVYATFVNPETGMEDRQLIYSYSY